MKTIEQNLDAIKLTLNYAASVFSFEGCMDEVKACDEALCDVEEIREFLALENQRLLLIYDLKKEVEEQCRLNAMGQERELALLAQIEQMKRMIND